MNSNEKVSSEKRQASPRMMAWIYVLFGYMVGVLTFVLAMSLDAKDSALSPSIPNFFSNVPTEIKSLKATDRRSIPVEILDHREFSSKNPLISGSGPIRICLATSMISGPIRNGGIATAFYNMARNLAEEKRNGAAVFNVTVYYAADPYYADGNFSFWNQKYAEWNINLVRAPKPEKGGFYGPKLVVRSFTAFRYFLAHEDDFDMITFPDYYALAYFTVLAKHQGLAFQKVSLMVQCHSTIRWTDEMNYRPPRGHDTLGYYYMEQKALELADARISPSKYFLEWMASESHYDFSSGLNFVIQNLYYPLGHYVPHEPRTVHTRHFAFFGRLEIRKGLMVFLEAVNFWMSSMPDAVKPTEISFVGPDTEIQGQRAVAIIEDHAARNQWNCTLRILTEFNTEQALAYLSDGVIAILPTINDNSPYVLLEMMLKGIPFITSDAGGGPELMKSKHGIVPAGDHKAFARAMADAAANGLETNQMEVDPVQTKKDYFDALISLVALTQHQAKEYVPQVTPRYKVTLGVPTHNRCDVLLETIEALANQDYPHELLHLILVDDASDDPATQETLAKVAEMLRSAGITHDIVVHKENAFVAASRNEIIEMSHSRKDDFICFMDDDDLAMPNMISTYMKVAAHTGTDILTDIAEHFDIINGTWSFSHTSLAVGGTFAHNFFINNYGKANFCAKSKEVYEMGGHQTGVKSLSPYVDWGFFTRASLNDLRIDLVPLPLYKYRKNSKGSIWYEQRSSKDTYYGHGKMLDDFKGVLPEKFHDVLQLCRYSLGKPAMEGDGPV